MKKNLSLAIVTLALFLSTTTNSQGEAIMIQDGRKVQIDYTLTVDGQVIDTSEGRTPLEYTQGEGMIIPGLEKELAGLKTGDSKNVTVTPAEGYGERNDDALREIPKSQFPPEITPEKGQQLSMKTSQGQQIPATIHEVKDDLVVLDLNHPLAGKELNFDVTVVSVK